MKKTGAYLPGAYEEVVEIVDAYVLTDKVSKMKSDNKVEKVMIIIFLLFLFQFCYILERTAHESYTNVHRQQRKSSKEW